MWCTNSATVWEQIQVPVVCTTTVDDVKAMVAYSRGIPPEQQRLVFADKQLEDGKLLDYGIQPDSTVQVLQLTNGGMERGEPTVR